MSDPEGNPQRIPVWPPETTPPLPGGPIATTGRRSETAALAPGAEAMMEERDDARTELERYRQALLYLGETMVLASTPGFLWRRLMDEAPEGWHAAVDSAALPCPDCGDGQPPHDATDLELCKNPRHSETVPPSIDSNPIDVIQNALDELGRVRFAFDREDERSGYITEALAPAITALEQVERVVKAAKALLFWGNDDVGHYAGGDFKTLQQALEPFIEPKDKP